MAARGMFIVTGPVNAGKTTFLKELVSALPGGGLDVAGFVSEKCRKEEERCDYLITDIRSGRSMPLSSRIALPGWTASGRLYFNRTAIDFGNELLSEVVRKGAGLAVVDEVGPLELEGLVWSAALDHLVSSGTVPMLWVVRSELVNRVLKRWYTGGTQIFDIRETTVPESVKNILSKLHLTS